MASVLAAVELGKAMGAKVIAAASSEEKLTICKEHGADETLLPLLVKWIEINKKNYLKILKS